MKCISSCADAHVPCASLYETKLLSQYKSCAPLIVINQTREIIKVQNLIYPKFT